MLGLGALVLGWLAATMGSLLVQGVLPEALQLPVLDGLPGPVAGFVLFVCGVALLLGLVWVAVLAMALRRGRAGA